MIREFWEFCTDPVTFGGLVALGLAGLVLLLLGMGLLAGLVAIADRARG